MLLRIQMAFHQVSFIFTNLSSHTKAFFYLRLKNSALELDGFSGGGERRGRERERERGAECHGKYTASVLVCASGPHSHASRPTFTYTHTHPRPFQVFILTYFKILNKGLFKSLSHNCFVYTHISIYMATFVNISCQTNQ